MLANTYLINAPFPVLTDSPADSASPAGEGVQLGPAWQTCQTPLTSLVPDYGKTVVSSPRETLWSSTAYMERARPPSFFTPLFKTDGPRSISVASWRMPINRRSPSADNTKALQLLNQFSAHHGDLKCSSARLSHPLTPIPVPPLSLPPAQRTDYRARAVQPASAPST
jgi:hypothetical protein